MELFPNPGFGWLNGWILIVLFFAVYGIILLTFLKKSSARLFDRTGQRKNQGLRRVSAVVLMLIWLFLVCVTPLKIGEVVFVIGMILFTLGLAGFVSALITFRNTPLDQPVTRGLYKISRHPQQVAVSFAFLGMSLASGSWTATAFMVLGFFGIHRKILKEEEACLRQYGEPYEEYMERIPRYFVFF